MGKPKKRVSPRVANQVNRDFERLILLSIIGAVVTFQMRRRGMDIAVDSSGFSLKTSSKWFDIRIKRIPLELTARRWRTKGGSHSSVSR